MNNMSIVILLMSVAIYNAENESTASESKTVDDSSSDDVQIYFVQDRPGGSIESRTIPVQVISGESAELSQSGAIERVDLSIAESQLNDPLRFFEDTDSQAEDSQAETSTKFRRPELESESDVSVNDDQKSDELNHSYFLDDETSKKVKKSEFESDQNIEKSGYDPLNDGLDDKENTAEIINIDSNSGDVSGRRMMQENIILDTKARSGEAFESINFNDMKAVPPEDFRTFDMLRPLGNVRPSYKNDLIIPYFPSFPQPGLFYTPTLASNRQMFFNRFGNRELIYPNFRRLIPGFQRDQPRWNSVMRSREKSNSLDATSNAYPYEPPLTATAADTLVPSYDFDVFKKLAEDSEFPKPQLQFSAGRLTSYQGNSNHIGLPRFYRNMYLDVNSNVT